MHNKEINGYKVDLDTPLETFLSACIPISAILAFIFLKDGYFGGKHSGPSPTVIPYGYFFLGLAVLFGLARYFTDCYYVVVEDEKSVYYRFKFLFFEQVDLFIRASEVNSVVVQGEANFSKRRRWYEYFVVLVDKNAKIIPFSEEFKYEAGLHEANDLAKAIASSLDLPVLTGQSEHQLVVEQNKGNIELSLNSVPLDAPMQPSENNPEVPIWLGVVLIIFATVGIVYAMML